MREERVDELLLVRYLLGNLTEEEQVRLEGQAFDDREYLNALEAAEADLIDAYVRGELPQEQRSAFEVRFLVAPQRRRKVEFARALAQVTEEIKAAELPVPRASGWRALVGAIRGWNPALQFATGMAALFCAVGAVWLIGQNSAMRSQVATVEAERHRLDLQQQDLRRQLEQERGRAETLAAQVKKQPSSTTNNPAMAILVLAAGLSRAGTQVEQLVLSPDAQVAHIDVQVEARDEYPRFRAELRTRGGDEVLIRGNLKRRQAGPGYSVSFDVPASALVQGEYELALKGVGSGGTADDVGYYYFAVVRNRP